MTQKEYSKLYNDLRRCLAGAVEREVAIDERMRFKQAELENKICAMFIVTLVSIIESEFLNQNTGWMKQLRNFIRPTGFPAKINAKRLSCYIYIRDCFAHNGDCILLPPGKNTTGFKTAMEAKTFPELSISGQSIKLKGTLKLHQIILQFF